MTLPADPRTLPNRTVTNFVLLRAAWLWTYSSATRLVQPITEVGLTALSVEIITNRSTPWVCAASANARVPPTLFFTASEAFHSIIGTCLWAAACRISVG